jgi:hypothetical protein
MSKHSLDDCINYAQDQNVLGMDTAFMASRRLWKKGSGGEAGFMKTLCYASLEQCDSMLYAARHYHKQLEEAGLEPRAIWSLQNEFRKNEENNPAE